MSISHRLGVIVTRKCFAYHVSLGQTFDPPPPHPHTLTPGRYFSESNHFIRGLDGSETCWCKCTNANDPKVTLNALRPNSLHISLRTTHESQMLLPFALRSLLFRKLRFWVPRRVQYGEFEILDKNVNKRPKGIDALLELLPDETSMDTGNVAEVTYLQRAIYF